MPHHHLPPPPPPPEGERLRILFLCTGNSCRSQMAEAFANQLHAGRILARSAGVAPHGLDPRAVRVMAEAGIDISGNQSKDLSRFLEQHWDWVITLCDHARESCPLFPGPARRLHAGFDDPPFLAREARSEDEALDFYRRVRDQIREFVAGLPQRLAQDLEKPS